MRNRTAIVCFVLAAAVFAALLPVARSGAQENTVILHFFYGRDCPHCKKIEPEIQSLVKAHPGLVMKKYEVWYDTTSRAMLMNMAKERGVSAQGVPTIIIGKDVYLGSDMAKIRALVLKNVKK